jgi:hypothetical protein
MVLNDDSGQRRLVGIEVSVLLQRASRPRPKCPTAMMPHGYRYRYNG